MHHSDEPTAQVSGLTRRHFVQAGAAGAAAVSLGTLGKLEGVAIASGGGSPELRRATYLSLSSPTFSAKTAAGAQTLELVGVGDLPIAETVTELRNRDDAFSIHLRGSADRRIEGGARTLSHPELGNFTLAIEPVDLPGEGQDYEAIVDRTVPLPSTDTGDAPPPAAEPQLPARAVDAKLAAASLRRSRSGRGLIVEIDLVAENGLRTVRALLRRRNKVVGRTVSRSRSTLQRLRFLPRGGPRRGGYELELTVVDRSGHVTSLRRKLRLR